MAESDEKDGSDIAVISYRLTAIEKAVSSTSESMAKLVVLEQKHIETREAMSRAFDEINSQERRIRALETEQQVLGASSHCESHGKRLTAIEAEMPTLKLTRGWVIAAASGSIGLLVIVVGKLLLELLKRLRHRIVFRALDSPHDIEQS
jgi:hypothetical protein